MQDALLINVDEMWLKGRNRPFYYQCLKQHIKFKLQDGFGVRSKIINEHQRLTVTIDVPFTDEMMDSIRRAPGVHSICLSKCVPLDIDEMEKEVIAYIDSFETRPKTFKMYVRRTNKSWPMHSMEMNCELGHRVLVHYNDEIKVDVKHPELVIDLKILDECAYLATKQMMGVGGLPVGTAGHMVTMLSGGFDSPVASYLLSCRGTKQTFAFFYAYPYVGDDVKEKIIKISEILGQYQKGVKLYIIPFGDIQDKIAKTCKEGYRTLLFRRLMVECSAYLCKHVKAQAIITGDSLGQVSSQTLENMCYLDKVTDRTIFRPLVGYNKIDIVNLSKKIGTHDVSIIPYDDACSLFAPKHPIIRPDIQYLKDYEKEVDFTEDIVKAIDEAEVHSISVGGKDMYKG